MIDAVSTANTAAVVNERFFSLHGRRPRVFRSPGRVNLLGEHTDYAGGYCLPTAVDRAVLIGASLRDDRRLTVCSLAFDETAELDLDDRAPRATRGHWSDLLRGVAILVEHEAGPVPGADLLLAGDLPSGAGLSSSAAVAVGVAYALSTLQGSEAWNLSGSPRAAPRPQMNRLAIAKLAQHAEEQFLGTECGLMDPLSIAFGQGDHALFIDCAETSVRPLPLDPRAASILICDTGVRRELASSAYNERRRQCAAALKRVRELTGAAQPERLDSLAVDALSAMLEPTLLRRARHVTSENGRVLAAAEALSRGDIEVLGRSMFESHQSLRDDYEVSTPELDWLVDTCASKPRVLGAKLTGAGFGGSVVALVRPDAITATARELSKAYAARFERPLEALVVTPSDGVREIA